MFGRAFRSMPWERRGLLQAIGRRGADLMALVRE